MHFLIIIKTYYAGRFDKLWRLQGTKKKGINPDILYDLRAVVWAFLQFFFSIESKQSDNAEGFR